MLKLNSMDSSSLTSLADHSGCLCRTEHSAAVAAVALVVRTVGHIAAVVGHSHPVLVEQALALAELVLDS